MENHLIFESPREDSFEQRYIQLSYISITLNLNIVPLQNIYEMLHIIIAASGPQLVLFPANIDIVHSLGIPFEKIYNSQ